MPSVETYGWASSEEPRSCGYISDEIIVILKKLGIRRVLDVGAGNGTLCHEMSRAGFEVVGGEYDEQGVKIAKESYGGIPFYRLDVDEDADLLLSHEKPFNAVVSTEVIEHLYSPHSLPIYAGKVLHSGGYLVISTPYHGYLKNLLLSIFNKWDFHHTPLWCGGHIKFWSRATLTKLLEQNGFTVTGFSGVGRLPYVWKSMILVARKLG